MNSRLPTTCTHCGGKDVYTRTVSSGGSEGPQLLKGLGGFLYIPKFDVVVCASCGYTAFFAESRAREKLKPGSGWVRTSQA